MSTTWRTTTGLDGTSSGIEVAVRPSIRTAWPIQTTAVCLLGHARKPTFRCRPKPESQNAYCANKWPPCSLMSASTWRGCPCLSDMSPALQAPTHTIHAWNVDELGRGHDGQYQAQQDRATSSFGCRQLCREPRRPTRWRWSVSESDPARPSELGLHNLRRCNMPPSPVCRFGSGKASTAPDAPPVFQIAGLKHQWTGDTLDAIGFVRWNTPDNRPGGARRLPAQVRLASRSRSGCRDGPSSSARSSPNRA